MSYSASEPLPKICNPVRLLISGISCCSTTNCEYQSSDETRGICVRSSLLSSNCHARGVGKEVNSIYSVRNPFSDIDLTLKSHPTLATIQTFSDQIRVPSAAYNPPPPSTPIDVVPSSYTRSSIIIPPRAR